MRFMEARIDPKKIPIICFGGADWRAVSDEAQLRVLEPVCYVRAEQIDVFGSVRTVALRNSIAQAAYIEPEPIIWNLD